MSELNRGQYFRFYGASLLGQIAGHSLNFGVVQYAQEILQAKALSGLALFLSFGTPIFLGLHAGALCDRGSALAVAKRTQWFFVFGALLLAAIASSDLAAAWQKSALLAGALLVGIAWSYVAPARLTYIVRVAAGPNLRRHSIIFNLLTTIGFGLAPLLLGVLRAAGNFFLAFLAAAAMVLLAQLLFIGLPQLLDAPATVNNGHWWREAKKLRSHLKTAIDVRRILIVCAVVHILLGPVQVLLQPLLARQFKLGVLGQGAFLALLAPVLIGGGILAMVLPAQQHPERPLLLASLLAFVGLLMTLAESLPLATLAFLVFGLSGGFGVASIAALLQARAAPEQRGKIMGLYAISTQFFPALGGLLSGVALALTNVQQALVLVVALDLMLYAPLFAPMWRNAGAK